MSDNYITEPDILDCEIEIIADAFALRESALKSASGIDIVENLYEANKAKFALEDLTELIKGIEASRTQAKKPALELGRKIDGIAKDFVFDAECEKNRIRKILGAYQRIEADKKREAEREARRKEQAIIDAAQAESEKRIAEERKGRTGTMLSDTESIAVKADKEIAAVRQDAANSHNAVAGLRVRKSLKFEIKDAAALLTARPDLFSPDNSKIRAAIKLTQSIPGLEIWEESTAY